jgi:hypothetical protein
MGYGSVHSPPHLNSNPQDHFHQHANIPWHIQTNMPAYLGGHVGHPYTSGTLYPSAMIGAHPATYPIFQPQDREYNGIQVNREREDMYVPSDRNHNLNGKSAYLLGHTNAPMPSNDTLRQVYFAQPCNVLAYPPLTYKDGNYGEYMVEMQTAGHDWGHDQNYSTMTFHSTAGINTLEGIGESQNTTIVAESTTFADNQVQGKNIPYM